MIIKYLRSRARLERSFTINSNLFTYSATGLANRNNYDIHNDGNENFHQQELKLNCTMHIAQRWLNIMQLGNKMQTAIYLRNSILHSHLIDRDLSAPVSLKCTDQVSWCIYGYLDLSVNETGNMIFLTEKPAVYIDKVQCAIYMVLGT